MAGVLFVCTANQCRSAIAERLARHALPVGVPVTSAGTHARPGLPIWPEAAVELERRGISALGFASWPLDAALVRGADLVLTATRAHRDEILAAHPSALGRAFTLRELAWLVTGLSSADLPGATAAERVAALAQVAGGRRGHLSPPSPAELDVEDPVGAPAGAVAAATVRIEAALAPVLALLSGAPATVGRPVP